MNSRALSSHTAVNPAWLSPQSYVDFLNRSFPAQWSRAAYDWYFTRVFDGRSPELLVVSQEERVISGLGLNYRQLQVGGDAPIDVAVMLAAATLPEARGAGHYSSLLQLAREQARLRGCAAMVAFATRDNVSGAKLRRLGWLAIPSFYLSTAPARGARRHGSVDAPPPSPMRMIDQLGALRGGVPAGTSSRGVRFYYRRMEDWSAQFLTRPHGTHLVRPAERAVALTETVRGTRRLQWLAARPAHFEGCIRALVDASRHQAQGFFMYSVNPAEARAARRAGCRIREGYLLVEPTGLAKGAWATLLGAAGWAVQSGDRL